MTALADWLDAHTAAAPPALRARVMEHALPASAESLPAALAAAAAHALDGVVAHAGDRSVALDLLAADALITLALLAQAERAPGELAAFAGSILQAVPAAHVIDLHSHLLPGVDDGSRTVEQSVGVLQRMAELGITDVCLTPHFRAAETAHGPSRRHDEAFAALEAEAPALPRLHRGAEVMLDRPLPGAAKGLRRVSLRGTRYLLVEFPRLVAADAVTNALTRVRDTGITPVLAHPERYGCCSVEAVAFWRTLGTRMQVDATTLLSPQARGQRSSTSS